MLVFARLRRLACRLEKIQRAPQRILDGVAGGVLEGGIDERDAELRVGQQHHVGRGINRGEQALGVRFQSQASRRVLDGDQRAALIKRCHL